jgi:hypothetical protein
VQRRLHLPAVPSGSARGVYAPSAFSTANRLSMAFLYGRAGRLTALFGGLRPGAVAPHDISTVQCTPAECCRARTVREHCGLGPHGAVKRPSRFP